MPDLYFIAGCNGAGKTTASYTILPEILNCREFVNADNIASGISPFNPESVALEAGRIMLKRINELLERGNDFGLETTLSTKSYMSLIKKAHDRGYKVSLLFFWLSSPQMAIERVAKRVSNGGHHIPPDVIERRYYRGINNLLQSYISVCDKWVVIDNTQSTPVIIARGLALLEKTIINDDNWEVILKRSNVKSN